MSQTDSSRPLQRTGAGRRWIFRLVAILGSLALAVAVGELVCRLAYKPRVPIRFQQGASVFEEDGIGKFFEKMEPDPELFWRFAPDQTITPSGKRTWRIISNHQRLREDHEIPLRKPDNEIRVLCLGDSCTFGFGLPIHETFVDQVEQQLQTLFPEKSVEAINAGVPGYTIFQGIRGLVRDGLNFDPDLVLVCFGNNERAMWDNLSDFEHLRYLTSIRPPSPFTESRLCQFTWSKFRRRPQNLIARPRLNAEEFRHILGQVKAVTDNQDIGLMYISWIWRVQALRQGSVRSSPTQRELLEFCRTESVPIINLMGLMRELCREHPMNEVYLDELHPTGLANARIAEQLAPAIASWYEDRKRTGKSRSSSPR